MKSPILKRFRWILFSFTTEVMNTVHKVFYRPVELFVPDKITAEKFLPLIMLGMHQMLRKNVYPLIIYCACFFHVNINSAHQQKSLTL